MDFGSSLPRKESADRLHCVPIFGGRWSRWWSRELVCNDLLTINRLYVCSTRRVLDLAVLHPHKPLSWSGQLQLSWPPPSEGLSFLILFWCLNFIAMSCWCLRYIYDNADCFFQPDASHFLFCLCMGLYWLRYIYYIYTYIEYILYRSNIEKYREKCQFIDCFFLSFIDVPKLIMSDSIELHLVWLLPYIKRLHVELFTSCWEKFCIKKDCIISVCPYPVSLMAAPACNGLGYIHV